MWPECQGTLSHAPFLDFLVVAMERRRTAVRAEILYTSLYIVFHLSQASLELYIYTSAIHLYILYILYIYTSYTLYIPIHSPSGGSPTTSWCGWAPRR